MESGISGVGDVAVVELPVSEVDVELVANTPVDIEDEVATVTSDDVVEVESTLLESGGFRVDDVVLVELKVCEVD